MACEVVDPISFSGSFYLALCGKACITASTCILSLYSTELFPTVVRSSGFGLCTSAAMIGGRFASSGLLIVDYVIIIVFRISRITSDAFCTLLDGATHGINDFCFFFYGRAHCGSQWAWEDWQ